MGILLKSENLKITNIIRKSTEDMLCDLAVGDEIFLTFELLFAGLNRGTSESYIRIENVNTGACLCKPISHIMLLLSCFDFKVV